MTELPRECSRETLFNGVLQHIGEIDVQPRIHTECLTVPDHHLDLFAEVIYRLCMRHANESNATALQRTVHCPSFKPIAWALKHVRTNILCHHSTYAQALCICLGRPKCGGTVVDVSAGLSVLYAIARACSAYLTTFGTTCPSCRTSLSALNPRFSLLQPSLHVMLTADRAIRS